MQLNVHHVRYAVKNVDSFSKTLSNQLHFRPYAVRSVKTNAAKSVVLRHQDAVFVVDVRLQEDAENDHRLCSGNNAYPVDTVCDICLNCSDIERVVGNARNLDVDSVKTKVMIINDDFGTVKFAVVKPPMGNVQHTLVDLSEYVGPFLPGFELINHESDCDGQSKQTPCDLIQTIDHVAFALNVGQTNEVMRWYNTCMGFSRLIINVDEDESGGFVVQEGEQGLRLKAILGPLKFSNCADCDKEAETPKFVFCEALAGDCLADQVTHFMKMHRGPGVQHIAFSTKDIVEAISHFKRRGLKCVLPPESYYREDSKHQEINRLNYQVETLKSNNILLESNFSSLDSSLSESTFVSKSLELEEQIKNLSRTQWFIMQVFTSPVFQEKTLFFEIIQRFQTLSGFGAGNIGALWRAVQKELFH